MWLFVLACAVPGALGVPLVPLARYALEGGAAADGIGSNDGTVSGATATTGVDGGGALAFDGVDDVVVMPAAVTATIGGTNARTVCLWALIDSFDDGGLFQYGTQATLQDFSVRTRGTTGVLRLQFYTTDVDLTITEATDGAWHHYCLAFDGTTVSFYFDGGSLYSGALALNTGECHPPPRPAPRAPLARRILVRMQARRKLWPSVAGTLITSRGSSMKSSSTARASTTRR